jgi:hypothetical protein
MLRPGQKELEERFNTEKMNDDDILKENLIRLAEHHKKHCDGPDCGISLFYVLRVAERAGLKFTYEEKRSFH